MAESNTGGSSSLSLSELFTSIANALRSKKGTTAAIPAKDFPAAIQGSGVQRRRYHLDSGNAAFIRKLVRRRLR